MTDAREVIAHSEPILTRILSEFLRVDDSQAQTLRLALLAECGRAMHVATANVLFHTVVLLDDDTQFDDGVSSTDESYVYHQLGIGRARTLFRNGARYGAHVRTLLVIDPFCSHTRSSKRESALFDLETHETEQDEDSEENAIRPISGTNLDRLLSGCTRLEELVWAASVPPPDGVCETLATRAPNLKRFTFSPSASTPVLKWDALSISHFPPLVHLGLSRLSQAGASALAANSPDARSLALDFVWLDDYVCERIARGTVRKLVIGTDGTKLTDRGIVALLEGCDVLEEMELVNVQGRLSKTLWTNVELPPTLTALRIAMSESGPHHSWTADHILSLASLKSLTQLTRLSITRIHSSGPGPVDDIAVAKPVPPEMIAALAECREVEHLECDWWLWSLEELKQLVEGCVGLQTLRITLDAPFARLLTLTSSFAHLAHLVKLYVTVPSTHAPSAPPSPTLPTPVVSPLALVNGYGMSSVYSVGGIGIRPASVGSPTSSPLSLARSLRSPKLPLPLPLPSSTSVTGEVSESPITPGAGQSFGAGNMNDQMETAVVDAVVPPLRDVRKFVRRCPKLVLLEWFGKTARGSWVAHREDAKSAASIKVEYVPPVLTDEDGGAWTSTHGGYGMNSPAAKIGLVPREGAEWTGPEAQAAAEAVRDYETERDAEIERGKEARRRRPSVSAVVKEARTGAKELKVGAKDETVRKRGASVSSGGVLEMAGKPRRRQSSAGEVLAKAKSAGTGGSPGKRGARRSP